MKGGINADTHCTTCLSVLRSSCSLYFHVTERFTRFMNTKSCLVAATIFNASKLEDTDFILQTKLRVVL